MKYNIYDWMGGKPFVDGVYETPEGFFIDIPDKQFAAKIRELCSKYDVMIRHREYGVVIAIDSKGRRFSQR